MSTEANAANGRPSDADAHRGDGPWDRRGRGGTAAMDALLLGLSAGGGDEAVGMGGLRGAVQLRGRSGAGKGRETWWKACSGSRFRLPRPLVNNVTHGHTESSAAPSRHRGRVAPQAEGVYGLPFGATVWAAGYVVLPAAMLYKPIWEYDVKTLAKDLSAHLVYGLATATALRLLSP